MSLVPAPTHKTRSPAGGLSVFSQKPGVETSSSGTGQSERPEADVMALARTVVDGLLEAHILGPPEQVEGAEWSGRIGCVEDERLRHSPGARQPQPIGCRPAGRPESGVKLIAGSDEHDVHRIARQPVAGGREARDGFALEDLETHAHHARQHDVGRDRVGYAEAQDPGKPVGLLFGERRRRGTRRQRHPGEKSEGVAAERFRSLTSVLPQRWPAAYWRCGSPTTPQAWNCCGGPRLRHRSRAHPAPTWPRPYPRPHGRLSPRPKKPAEGGECA